MDSLDHIEKIPSHKIRSHIRSGDILLASGNSTFSSLIQRATKILWSHVAFVLRIDQIDRIMVLESVESIGVRTIPLSNYVNDYNGTNSGYPGKLMIARHTDFNPENIGKLSRIATSLLGHPYNQQEIIRVAMRIGMGEIGIKTPPKDPTNNKSFICSEYAHLCFKSVEVKITRGGREVRQHELTSPR